MWPVAGSACHLVVGGGGNENHGTTANYPTAFEDNHYDDLRRGGLRLVFVHRHGIARADTAGCGRGGRGEGCHADRTHNR